MQVILRLTYRNKGIQYGKFHGPRVTLKKFIENVNINLPAVRTRINYINLYSRIDNDFKWLLHAVSLIDLTSLSGDDTISNIQRLCVKACYPIRKDILNHFNINDIHCAAVCVYPRQISNVVLCLKTKKQIKIAAVAGGFPSGQFHLETHLNEIQLALNDGATEIDVVINRGKVLSGNWESLYEELCQIRMTCKNVIMKTILSAGELGSLSNIYKASIIAMMAGSDFIKTSTGKEVINATPTIGLIMMRAIKEYYNLTNYKVGFKPAGGIRNYKQALNWILLMKEELGNSWLNTDLFRIGASGLLFDIERYLYTKTFCSYPSTNEFPLC